MGNANTKESRPADSRGFRSALSPEQGSSSQPNDGSSSRRNRTSRSDLSNMLGLSSSAPERPQEQPARKETKQEREARRLERERQQRLAERERSLKEEHVDGGYLVTLGTYVGPEDFNKQVCRQLQIERKLAPFWRGLQDVDEQWAEHQIIAAARGLDIPAADETPPDELIPKPLSPISRGASTQNLNNLTVPIGERSPSFASDKSASNPTSTLPSPTSPPARGSSPFKPRAKALAAALVSSRNSSTTEIAPREINLPADPFVNGQPLEVFLYKDACECPICFLSYPPYLNHTRCCDQPICSECFVQIKRADPHYPEGHGDNEAENANIHPEEQAGQLISEPACCPYCQQPDFGVTYDPPPFRRGLIYSMNPAALGAHHTAMSSSSSLHTTGLSPPTLGSPTPDGSTPLSRRRTQSLSANAPNVITTDRIRPDWSTKLATQRAHIARRAAAATALHTAAFLIHSNESRPLRVSRFSRRNTGTSSNNAGLGSLAAGSGEGADGGSSMLDPGTRSSPNQGTEGGTGSRNRMDDLEELMFREALRQSLATEEERRRKYEKELRKDAKRREKEERKAAKAAAKQAAGPYGSSGSGLSSATGSSLSLSGLGLSRRRGNSAASNLRMEASVANAKNAGGSSGSGSGSGSGSNGATSPDKGKAVDRGSEQHLHTRTDTAPSSATSSSPPMQIPTSTSSAGPSHLRQMSMASSVGSSDPESASGSYKNPSNLLLQDPRASGLSLGGRSEASEEGGQPDDKDPSNSIEPMFNFSSLAEMVGVQLEGENAGRRLSAIGRESLGMRPDGAEAAADDSSSTKDGAAEVEHEEHVTVDTSEIEQSTSTLRPKLEHAAANSGDSGTSSLAPPQLTITPETPAPYDEDGESKQLGHALTEADRTCELTH